MVVPAARLMVWGCGVWLGGSYVTLTQAVHSLLVTPPESSPTWALMWDLAGWPVPGPDLAPCGTSCGGTWLAGRYLDQTGPTWDLMWGTWLAGRYLDQTWPHVGPHVGDLAGWPVPGPDLAPRGP